MYRYESRILPGRGAASEAESCRCSEVQSCEWSQLCVAGVQGPMFSMPKPGVDPGFPLGWGANLWFCQKFPKKPHEIVKFLTRRDRPLRSATVNMCLFLPVQNCQHSRKKPMFPLQDFNYFGDSIFSLHADIRIQVNIISISDFEPHTEIHEVLSKITTGQRWRIKWKEWVVRTSTSSEESCTFTTESCTFRQFQPLLEFPLKVWMSKIPFLNGEDSPNMSKCARFCF